MSFQTLVRAQRAAERHGGFFTTAEASASGLRPDTLRRLVATGALDRVLQGVYRLPGTPLHEHDDILSLWLAVGGRLTDPDTTPPVVVAGEAAANLYGLGDFFAFTTDFIAQSRRTTRHQGVRFRIRHLDPADVQVVDRVPVLSVEATIADLLSIHTDLSLIEDATRDAVRAGTLTDPHRLAHLLSPYARRRGHQPGDGLAVLAEITPWDDRSGDRSCPE